MPGDSDSNALELRAVRYARMSVNVGPVNATAPKGQFTVFRGALSSGKELFLRILGLLETADQGEVLVEGKCVRELDEPALTELRRRHFGYLFAAPFLLPAFTVMENVVMPMFKLLDSGPSEARMRAEQLLAFVGAGQYEQERAGDLPLFEQRCVALARALATDPAVLLVEDLDAELRIDQQQHFSKLLRSACQRWRITVVATTSPAWVAGPGDLVYEVAGGRVEMAPAPLSQS
jgi:lipoprotein-releasing system ATP-binding protein